MKRESMKQEEQFTKEIEAILSLVREATYRALDLHYGQSTTRRERIQRACLSLGSADDWLSRARGK